MAKVDVGVPMARDPRLNHRGREDIGGRTRPIAALQSDGVRIGGPLVVAGLAATLILHANLGKTGTRTSEISSRQRPRTGELEDLPKSRKTFRPKAPMGVTCSVPTPIGPESRRLHKLAAS